MPAYSEKDTCLLPTMPQSHDSDEMRAWFMARDHVCIIGTDLLLKEAQGWPRPKAEQARSASGQIGRQETPWKA